MFKKIALLIPAVAAKTSKPDCEKQLSGSYDCPMDELVDMYAKASAPGGKVSASSHCRSAKNCMAKAMKTERLTLAKTKLAVLALQGKLAFLKLQKEQNLSSNADEEIANLHQQLFDASEAHCEVLRNSVFVKSSIRSLTADEAKECEGLSNLIEDKKQAAIAEAAEKAKNATLASIDTRLDAVLKLHVQGVLDAKSVVEASTDKTEPAQVLESRVADMCGAVKDLGIESYEGASSQSFLQTWCPSLLEKEAEPICQAGEQVQETIAGLLANNSTDYTALLQLDETCSSSVDGVLAQLQAGEVTPEVGKAIAAIVDAVAQYRLARSAAKCDALVSDATEQTSLEELLKIQQVANSTQCDSAVMQNITDSIEGLNVLQAKCQQLITEREGLTGEELKEKIAESEQAGCEIIAKNNRESSTGGGLSPWAIGGGVAALGTLATGYMYKDKIMEKINSFRGKGAAATGAAASGKGSAAQTKPKKGLSGVAIAGIVVGLVVLVALGAWMVYRYRRRQND